MGKSHPISSIAVLVCTLTHLFGLFGQAEEACQFGFYCDGMKDPLMKSQCVNGVCVCSGELTQRNCLPRVSGCVIKEGSTNCSYPASVCTSVSSNYICSRDFETYHCYDNTNPTYEVHVLGSYQAKSYCSDVPETSKVQVVRKGDIRRKVIIVLASTRPVAWYLDMESGIVIERVILVSKIASLATVSWSRGNVKMISKLTNISEGQNSLYGKGSDSIKLLKYLDIKYGPITSFTGRFQVDQWRLQLGWPFKTGTSHTVTSSFSTISMDTPAILNSRGITSSQMHIPTSTPSASPLLNHSGHVQITASSPKIHQYSSVHKIPRSIPQPPHIVHSISVFQVFGVMEMRHISGFDYYANGTVRLSYPVTAPFTNITSSTQTRMASSSEAIKASPTKIFSSITDFHKIFTPQPSSSLLYRTTMQPGLQTTSSRPLEKLSSTPVINLLPSSSTHKRSSVVPLPTTSSKQTMAASSSVVAEQGCQVENPCHQHAICSDTTSGISCTCKNGFTGNGLTDCKDIDECLTFPCPTSSDCKNTPGSYNCTCREEGSCRNTRLVSSVSVVSNEGRVEVLHNGQWGSVCTLDWDMKDAQVACRDAGYPYVKGVLHHTMVPDGKGMIWLSQVNCNGSETKLSDCPHPGFGNIHSGCTHFFDSGVKCDPQTVRIVGTDKPDEGRVEIYHGGQWGTICDNDWDYDDADVVCFSLGFEAVDTVLLGPQVPDGVGKIWLDKVDCYGIENDLSKCQHNGWGKTTCGHDKDAGVKCITKVNCTFELNTCSWRNVQQGDDFDWQRHQGSTPTLLTGPKFDHTKKTAFGVYLYIETSGRKPGQKAHLVSPELSARTNQCLTFYYHMEGSDVAQLNVNLRKNGTSSVKRLWNLSGSKKDKWIQAMVPLNFSETSEIIFEAVSGRDQKGDIALDDISIVPSPCTVSPESAAPDTDECLTNPCHVNAMCTNTIGSYICKCNGGFSGNGTVCTDIDECVTRPCHENATCHNVDGGFYCVCNNNTGGICDDAYRPCGVRQIFRKISSKVIGGNTATKGSWPWQAAIYYSAKPKYIWCGGAVINHKWVVTAAHCFDQSKTLGQYRVVLGEHDVLNPESEEEHFKVKDIILHPGYKSSSKNYDIALIELSSPVNYTDHILPICLADRQFSAGTQCFITGWGTRTVRTPDYPQFLQEAVVPTISFNTCKTLYSFTIITPYMMCAGYTTGTIDACQGDSGGPLVCQHDNRWYLAGLTSFGSDCAASGYPGVYANVFELRSWVYSVIY